MYLGEVEDTRLIQPFFGGEGAVSVSKLYSTFDMTVMTLHFNEGDFSN